MQSKGTQAVLLKQSSIIQVLLKQLFPVYPGYFNYALSISNQISYFGEFSLKSPVQIIFGGNRKNFTINVYNN